MPTADSPSSPPSQAPSRGPSETPRPAPQLAVVVPVHNEAENVKPLIAEIHQALADGVPFEVIYVDDGSSDGTKARLGGILNQYPRLRVIRHRQRCGQSAAVATGVKAATAPIIATLDGDGQNDPADIQRLLTVFNEAEDPDLVLIAGLRAKRQDTWVKRAASRIANRVRSALLADNTPDTGCGLKVFSRDAFLDMPGFDHMHRFLPALMIRRGGRVISVPVDHRRRRLGRSNYGVFDRLWVGIVDLFGVLWLKRRGSLPEIEFEIEAEIEDEIEDEIEVEIEAEIEGEIEGEIDEEGRPS